MRLTTKRFSSSALGAAMTLLMGMSLVGCMSKRSTASGACVDPNVAKAAASFKEKVQAAGASSCTSCHMSSQKPTFMMADPALAYAGLKEKNAAGKTHEENFQDYAENGHCGAACAAGNGLKQAYAEFRAEVGGLADTKSKCGTTTTETNDDDVDEDDDLTDVAVFSAAKRMYTVAASLTGLTATATRITFNLNPASPSDATEGARWTGVVIDAAVRSFASGQAVISDFRARGQTRSMRVKQLGLVMNGTIMYGTYPNANGADVVVAASTVFVAMPTGASQTFDYTEGMQLSLTFVVEDGVAGGTGPAANEPALFTAAAGILNNRCATCHRVGTAGAQPKWMVATSATNPAAFKTSLLNDSTAGGRLVTSRNVGTSRISQKGSQAHGGFGGYVGTEAQQIADWINAL